MPASTLWHANLYQPLVDLGHDVVVFDFDYSEFNYNLDQSDPKQLAFTETNRPRLSEQLKQQFGVAHAKAPIDLFFSYFYSSYVEPDAIRDIGAAGPVTVNWYCNASYQFALVEEIAPAYDYCLVPERFRLDDYRRVGATPIYCQEAANPDVYRPYDVPRVYDVAFVGQRYGDRGAFLRRLIDDGIDARAWGPLWNEPSPALPAWRQVAGRAKRTALPPARAAPRHGSSRPLRTALERPRVRPDVQPKRDQPWIHEGRTLRQQRPRVEASAASRLRGHDERGLSYLVETCEELTEFFEPDREIVCFSNSDELVAKARYYLRRDDERERIRLAGLARARVEHTWHARFKSVFSQIGLA